MAKRVTFNPHGRKDVEVIYILPANDRAELDIISGFNKAHPDIPLGQVEVNVRKNDPSHQQEHQFKTTLAIGPLVDGYVTYFTRDDQAVNIAEELSQMAEERRHPSKKK